MSDSPATIHQLVERFSMHREAYHAAGYNETQLRREFLDPFFEALGWDVDNKQNFHEAYKEVIHEDSIKIGEWTKAPDYCFRIGGVRKFFVEAKKPAVNIKDDVGSAYQVRRYAWSAKLPLSILTNFEGFAVYDCRQRPNPNDKASVGRVLYISWDEYERRWDEIASVFSREAIPRGGFDKYADSSKVKRGTTEVDDTFLDDIESWRKSLASNLAVRNPSLTQRDLNFAVQRTIDRIIFLRICEDRGIEQYGTLQALLGGPNVYARLAQLFHAADRRYNSGLFHFQKENDRAEPPDDLTLDLAIDDKALKDIIKRLYYPECPYAFSVLGADILGHIYEQFLGKVIRLTAGHHAVVEDKPEVKKAGGVYYTPTYIVDYIVKHTVGKLLEGKSPREISGKGRTPFSVLDPACGSGSFLIGAYQYLLNWHLDWYFHNDPEKWCAGKNPVLTKSGTEVVGGGYRLSTAERKRILTTHIYGVDIDAQAVETTKLSLLLKVLEGENDTTIKSQLTFFHERALPDLGSNIKCGNSLIGSDFYDGTNLSLFDDDAKQRINAFDWKTEFPAIVRGGGFDAVVGNPPYIRIQVLREWAPAEVEFYKRKYSAASAGNYDLYVVFVEKGLNLLNEEGQLGFILPSKFFTTDYGLGIRAAILKRSALAEIVDFGHGQVFKNATTYTCLLFLKGSSSTTVHYYLTKEPRDLSLGMHDPAEMKTADLTAEPWVFQTDSGRTIATKLKIDSVPLLELPCAISRGSSSGADDVFVLKMTSTGLESVAGEIVDIEPQLLRIPIFATDFGRYSFDPKADNRIIVPYHISKDGYSLIEEEEMRSEYPKAFNYLSAHRRHLMERKQFSSWYGFSAPRSLDKHEGAQMLIPLLATLGSVCRTKDLKEKPFLMAGGGFSITVDASAHESPEYVLGLLNSRLLFWQLRSISNKFRGGWITCTKQYVRTLPIRRTAYGPSDLQNEIATQAKAILALHAKFNLERNTEQKVRLQREIAATDAAIDKLVYELYGLSEEEVGVVEGEK